jgi:hypothetical protein
MAAAPPVMHSEKSLLLVFLRPLYMLLWSLRCLPGIGMAFQFPTCNVCELCSCQAATSPCSFHNLRARSTEMRRKGRCRTGLSCCRALASSLLLPVAPASSSCALFKVLSYALLLLPAHLYDTTAA